MLKRTLVITISILLISCNNGSSYRNIADSQLNQFSSQHDFVKLDSQVNASKVWNLGLGIHPWFVMVMQNLSVNIGPYMAIYSIFMNDVHRRKIQLIIDKLEEIDEKLDLIQEQLFVVIGLNQAILKQLDEIYMSIVGNVLLNAFLKIDTETGRIKTIYREISLIKPFGDANQATLDQVFEYALHNPNRQIYEKLNNTENHKLYVDFDNIYVTQSTIWEEFVFNKDNLYKSILARPSDGVDLMDLVKYNNYKFTNAIFQLSDALEKLYMVEFIQLVYYYANPGGLYKAHNKMDFTNIGRLPNDPNKSSLENLKVAVTRLRALFQQKQERLWGNMRNSFTIISNNDLVKYFNTYSGTPFNESTFLLPEESELSVDKRNYSGKCSLESVKHNIISNKHGYLQVLAKCVLGESTLMSRDSTLQQRVLYSIKADGTIGQFITSNIRFESQTDTLLGVASRVERLFLQDLDMEKVDLLSSNTGEGLLTAWYNFEGCWGQGQIDFRGIYVYPYPSYKSDHLDDLAREALPDKDYITLTGGVVNDKIKFGSQCRSGKYPSIYQEWNYSKAYMASANSHIFKVVFKYSIYASMDLFMYIDCSFSSCEKGEGNIFYWSDGTKIIVDTGLPGKLEKSPNWHIYLVSAPKTVIFERKFNFVPAEDMESNNLGDRIFLNNKVFIFNSESDMIFLTNSRVDANNVYQYRFVYNHLNGSLGVQKKVNNAAWIDEYHLATGIKKMVFSNGDIRLFSNVYDTKPLWEISKMYVEKGKDWINDPFAELALSANGTLAVFSSDKSGQIGFSSTISSGEEHYTRALWSSAGINWESVTNFRESALFGSHHKKPRGSYKASCKDIAWDYQHSILAANCKMFSESYNHTILDYRTCIENSLVINNDGRLECNQAKLPSGPYKDSCHNITWDMSSRVLRAFCLTKQGINNLTELNYRTCASGALVTNDDGRLAC